MGGFGGQDFSCQKIFAFFLSPAGPRDCRSKADRSQDPPVHDPVVLPREGIPDLDLSLRVSIIHQKGSSRDAFDVSSKAIDHGLSNVRRKI